MDFFGIDENQFNLYIDLEIAEVGKKRWAHSQKEWPVCILNSMKDMEADNIGTMLETLDGFVKRCKQALENRQNESDGEDMEKQLTSDDESTTERPLKRKKKATKIVVDETRPDETLEEVLSLDGHDKLYDFVTEPQKTESIAHHRYNRINGIEGSQSSFINNVQNEADMELLLDFRVYLQTENLEESQSAKKNLHCFNICKYIRERVKEAKGRESEKKVRGHYKKILMEKGNLTTQQYNQLVKRGKRLEILVNEIGDFILMLYEILPSTVLLKLDEINFLKLVSIFKDLFEEKGLDKHMLGLNN